MDRQTVMPGAPPPSLLHHRTQLARLLDTIHLAVASFLFAAVGSATDLILGGGVIRLCSGNHAQAIALAAKMAGESDPLRTATRAAVMIPRTSLTAFITDRRGARQASGHIS